MYKYIYICAYTHAVFIYIFISCLISGGKYGPKKTYSLMVTNLRGSKKNLGPLALFQGELWHFKNGMLCENL